MKLNADLLKIIGTLFSENPFFFFNSPIEGVF